MKEYQVSHMVKSEDLNHHRTLFAGRASEWLVEATFVAAAAKYGDPHNIVCLNIHGFIFKKSVTEGEILNLKARIAAVGKTSITVYVKAESEFARQKHVDGFVTYICVESDKMAKRPHGIVLDDTTDEEELEIRARAAQL